MSPTNPPPGQAPCGWCRAVRGLRSGGRSFFPVPSATRWLDFSFAHVSGDREPREVSRLLEGWPRRVYICFLPDARAENNMDLGPHTVSELGGAEWLSWAMLVEALGGGGAASSGGLTRGVPGPPPRYSCMGISSVAARFLRERERGRGRRGCRGRRKPQSLGAEAVMLQTPLLLLSVGNKGQVQPRSWGGEGPGSEGCQDL